MWTGESGSSPGRALRKLATILFIAGKSGRCRRILRTPCDCGGGNVTADRKRAKGKEAEWGRRRDRGTERPRDIRVCHLSLSLLLVVCVSCLSHCAALTYNIGMAKTEKKAADKAKELEVKLV